MSIDDFSRILLNKTVINLTQKLVNSNLPKTVGMKKLRVSG